MKDARFGVNTKFVMLTAPVDAAATANKSAYVDLKNANWATFLVPFGVITATSADQAVIVTLECSTAAASNATEVQLPFKYRASAAVNTDTGLGAITSATAAGGASIATTDDAKLLLIDLDPAVIDGLLTDGRWVRVVVTPDAGASVTLVGVIAALDPMYPQLTQLSAS